MTIRVEYNHLTETKGRISLPCTRVKHKKVYLNINIFFQHWFTELPPVLTFELSRFEFNQALGRPEKIHNKLEFPSMLYMDRWQK